MGHELNMQIAAYNKEVKEQKDVIEKLYSTIRDLKPLFRRLEDDIAAKDSLISLLFRQNEELKEKLEYFEVDEDTGRRQAEVDN